MEDVAKLLERWQMDQKEVRRRMYRSATPRERERWHGLWLLAQGWTATQVAEALERDVHTIGEWLANFRRAGAGGLVFEQTGSSPRPKYRSTGPTNACSAKAPWGGWDRFLQL